jgi:hypothetical protein
MEAIGLLVQATDLSVYTFRSAERRVPAAKRWQYPPRIYHGVHNLFHKFLLGATFHTDRL